MGRFRGVAAGLAIAAILAGQGSPASAVDLAGFDGTFAGDGEAELAGPGPWQVAVDDLDRTVVLTGTSSLRRFGADGSVDTAFGTVALTGDPTPSAVRVLDDGTISVLRRSSTTAAIERFDPSGVHTARFGTNGLLALPGTSLDRAVTEAGDGSIVVEQSAAAGTVSLARFDATGVLDAGFAGDGTAQISCCGDGSATVDVKDLLLEPDGTIAVLAESDAGDVALQVESDGESTGSAALPTDSAEELRHLAALPDGSFIVVSYDPLAYEAIVRRIATGPAVDLAFGGSGTVRFRWSSWREPILQEDRLVLALDGTSTNTLIGLNPAGLDPTFGTEGTLSIAGPSSIYALSYAVRTIQTIGLSGGQLLTVGQATWNTVNQFETPYRTVVTQRDANGNLQDTHNYGYRWMGPVVARGDGSALLVPSDTTPFLATVPPTASMARFVPTDPLAPVGPVQDLSAEVEGLDVHLAWSPPLPTQGLRLNGYEGAVTDLSSGSQLSAWSGAEPSRTVKLPTAGRAYRIDVAARGAQGAGPVPDPPLLVIAHFASIEAFAGQVAGDFEMAPPTSADLASFESSLADGSINPEFAVRAANIAQPWATRLHPVVRLYSAYFGRPPDPSGLRFWTAKRAAGVSLAKISATFADSSEFRRTYGSLSNLAFVQLVYQNVLDRPADAGGLTYWTGRLDARQTSRGILMAAFSESGEHIRKQERTVRTIGLYWGMLKRLPSATELQMWAGPSPAGDEAALALSLLTSSAYLARLP